MLPLLLYLYLCFSFCHIFEYHLNWSSGSTLLGLSVILLCMAEFVFDFMFFHMCVGICQNKISFVLPFVYLTYYYIKGR